MAFCNSCGAPLNEGTKFCNKCGNAVTGAPAAAAQPITPAPPPSKGGSSALKMVLIIVGVIVLIGILGVATIGIVGYRIAKSAHVSQKGDNVKVETPFGSMETSTDPDKTAEELGVEIYPGAQVQKAGTASVTFGSLHTVTANFESSDSVDKICDFYKQKFPSAQVSSSDQNRCSIISGDKGNSTTITVQPSGDGSRFTIVTLTKKS
ncbi:MAG TPA: zinc-ribbon domain-containing protein [Candidatus Udaeobacter sp.]|nr:zinc-ribbon domain-containing protein [Candidatus Udaeobacter sp.]